MHLFSVALLLFLQAEAHWCGCLYMEDWIGLPHLSSPPRPESETQSNTGFATSREQAAGTTKKIICPHQLSCSHNQYSAGIKIGRS